MKTNKAFRLPSGSIVPAGTELHFSNEGQGFYNGEAIDKNKIPAVALEGKRDREHQLLHNERIDKGDELYVFSRKGRKVLCVAHDSPFMDLGATCVIVRTVDKPHKYVQAMWNDDKDIWFEAGTGTRMVAPDKTIIGDVTLD